MAHWSIQDLESEIIHLADLNKVRHGQEIVDRMAAQVAHKLEHCGKVTPTVLVRLSEAISKANLPSDMTDLLQKTLDDRALDDSKGCLELVNKGQINVTIYNYLSVEELKQIRTAPMHTMVQIVIRRMRAIGIRSLKECTKKAACAYIIFLLLQRGEPQPTSVEIYRLAEYFRTCFAVCRQSALDFIKKAYGTDKPVEPNLETASAVAAQMKYTPVRDTSLLLAESLGMSKKKRQLKVSSDIDINGELLAGLAKLVSQAKNMDSESSLETRVKEAARPSFKEKRSFSVESITKSNSQSSLASLHLESPHTEIEPLPLPAAPEGNEENEKEKDSALLELPVSKPEAIASGQMEKAKEDSKPTLEDFEQQAYDELQGKTVMKRPSAHPQMMKKPAACTKQTLAAPDTKEPKAGSKRKAKLTCYGCSRCRGNPHGCSSCAIESYKGERLNGREAWKKFMHKKQRGK
ncbi:Uncharacterized protein SCF082_LOCUS34739 [Durusdinium trenchii]|uniref:Uncharacterized protein n=1 Tax=Durusdinium trenchii TaxID=1381693 RepID=A0ABP0P0N1_9DINO